MRNSRKTIIRKRYKNSMAEIIKTEDFLNFCGGCNNSVRMRKFVVVDEGEPLEEAVKKMNENQDDEIFKRKRFMGFCICGNVWLK